LQPQPLRLAGGLVQKVVDASEVVHCTIDGMIDCLEPFDEDAHHRSAKLGTLLSITANFSVELLKVNSLARFRNRAI
jgi:hypothetical protein